MENKPFFQTLEGKISNMEFCGSDDHTREITQLKLSIDLFTPTDMGRNTNGTNLMDIQCHGIGIICHKSTIVPRIQLPVSSTISSNASINLPIQNSIPDISNNSQNPLREVTLPYENMDAIDYFIEKTTERLSCSTKQVGRCPICFESIVQREPTVTKCGHVFCRECIEKSLSSVRKCPLCQCRVRMNQLLRIYL